MWSVCVLLHTIIMSTLFTPIFFFSSEVVKDLCSSCVKMLKKTTLLF